MSALRLTIFAAILALLAVALPLPVYAISLGAFGLVHVFSELRYVDLRFAGRVPRGLLLVWSGLLGAVVVVRVLAMSGVLVGDPRALAELGVVILLAVSVFWLTREHGPRTGLLGAVAVTVVALLLYGSAEAPFATLVVLAFLHNLTPVAFLAERLDGAQRHRAMAICAALFGLVPILIVTGLPRQALDALGWSGASLAIPGVGAATDHLGVFVPTWLSGSAALNLFTAAVYLQCLHYAVVIGVLPRLLPEGARQGAIRWPRPSVFAVGLAVVGAISLCAFAISFSETRELYGVFAAVHAWIEVPVLLAALTLVQPRTPEVAPS